MNKQNDAIIKTFKESNKIFHMNVIRINFLLARADYTGARAAVDDCVDTLKKLRSDVDTVKPVRNRTDEDKTFVPKLIECTQNLIDTILTTLEPSIKDFLFDEGRCFKKWTVSFSSKIDPDCDFKTVKKQVLSQLDSMIETVESFTQKIESSQRVVRTESTLSTFMEAYFGTTACLKEAELVLGQFMEEMRKTPDADYINHKLNTKFCNLLKKQFGFASVQITWLNLPDSGGMTIPNVQIFFGGKSAVHIDKTQGYYDRNHVNHVWIYMDKDYILRNDFTPREMLAIILHEIGHNFDNSLWMVAKVVSDMGMTVVDIVYGAVTGDEARFTNGVYGIIPALGYTSFYHAMTGMMWSAYNEVIHKYPEVGHIEYVALRAVNDFDYLKNKYGAPFRLYNNIMKTVRSGPAMVKNVIRNTIKSVPERKGEEFADSFATAYGYGPDLASALGKINGVYKYTQSKSTSIFADICLLNFEIVRLLNGNDHGSRVDRARDMIRQLTADIQSAKCTPEMKKAMLGDIKRIEQTISKWENAKECRMPITACFFKCMDIATRGNSDIMSAIFPPNLVSSEGAVDDILDDDFFNTLMMICD